MSGAPSNQNCPECGHPMSGHGLYGCSYGVDAEQAALRREAAAFRWLADGIAKGDVNIWINDECEGYEVILDCFWGEGPRRARTFTAPTLLEACEKAMAAEGGAK